MCEMYLQDSLASGWASAARISAVGEKVDTTAQARGRPRGKVSESFGGSGKTIPRCNPVRIGRTFQCWVSKQRWPPFS